MCPAYRYLCVLALIVAAAAQGADGDHAAQQKLEVGRKVFTEVAQPSCGLCHVLRNAGAAGTIGPDLDEIKPDAERVAIAVRNGVGVMPAFAEQLTPAQIEAIALYVSRAAGSSP